MNKKIISYTLLFSFLFTVSGCYTTQSYSDTPDKIFSGKSDIDLKGDYTLDSISLRNKRTITLENYVAYYIERQKEKYLLYYNPKLIVIDYAFMQETKSKDLLFKKPVADTISFNAIDSMYFTGSKTDVSYAVLGCVIGIPVALFISVLLFAMPNFGTNH
jgi:hypothetical protein